MHEVEFAESLTGGQYYFVCQTKLFFLNRNKSWMFQWNLLTMTFDMHYFVDCNDFGEQNEVVINKSQTLLALKSRSKINVFSMETGMHISSYS